MHTRLEAIDGNKTKLIVIANVVWDKQTILKSKIETETINGMKKYYDVVEKELISSINEAGKNQRYTYRVLQTIQTKLILLCVWAELAVLGSTKTALKFKYEI